MRVLVTGARGMLGRQVAREYQKRGVTVYPLARQELDITNCEQVFSILDKIGPNIVVNCAAYTDVDGAEQEKEKAFLMNGLGPRYLALACRRCGAALVQISTDYIFDGKAEGPYRIYDTPCPINIYGASKLFGEASVREIGGRFYIARTSWLFGPDGKNFADTILSLARERDELKVVNDQHGTPTYTVDLAGALADLADSKAYGTYHVTNSGSASWYELAKTVVYAAGLNASIAPCKTREFPRPAARPGNSVLDPFPLKQVIGYNLPGWEDAARRYLKEKTVMEV